MIEIKVTIESFEPLPAGFCRQSGLLQLIPTLEQVRFQDYTPKK
jgi:hypothetical protein